MIYSKGMAEKGLQFPEGFLWGTATSSHQIEGNNTQNDWWHEEQAGRLPHASGAACDSYNRYEEDFDLARGLHNNAHRLSIEWSRIEPREGEFNEQEIEHYRHVIRALRERSLEPFVTLHHFTNPVWFTAGGGWGSKKAPEYFERYARYVAERLGRDVTYWMTINEPFIVNSAGYLDGRWPPFRRHDFLGFIRATRTMVRAHKRAYGAIHAINSKAQVGLAKNNNYFEPARGIFKVGNAIYARALSYVKNEWFLNAISSHHDFIALNYYNHYKVHVLKGSYQDRGVRPLDGGGSAHGFSDFGWEIYPEGLYHTIKTLQKYHKPIFITENGIADADDDQRPQFIRDHLRWVHKAIGEGADVRGYFYWSLLDNFEWAEGFTQRFGLVEVNFETFGRTPRGSYTVYKEICENNGLNSES